MIYIPSSGWAVEIADHRAEKELKRLAVDVQADFLRLSRLVQAYGLEALREPYFKQLEGKLWEMRMRGRDGIARAATVIATGKRLVVVHCFVKKTQKTPRNAIELALRRAKEGGFL
jgi:phage-related protein